MDRRNVLALPALAVVAPELPAPVGLAKELLALGPDPSLATELRLYGQFVGEWDFVLNERSNGVPRTLNGRWFFGWVLGGRAVQDVWLVPQVGVERGTTLRTYDPEIGQWRISYHGPRRGAFAEMTGRAVGAEIVQDGTVRFGTESVQARWTFFDVTRDHFQWRNELHVNEQWYQVQHMDAKRR